MFILCNDDWLDWLKNEKTFLWSSVNMTLFRVANRCCFDTSGVSSWWALCAFQWVNTHFGHAMRLKSCLLEVWHRFFCVKCSSRWSSVCVRERHLLLYLLLYNQSHITSLLILILTKKYLNLLPNFLWNAACKLKTLWEVRLYLHSRTRK